MFKRKNVYLKTWTGQPLDNPGQPLDNPWTTPDNPWTTSPDNPLDNLPFTSTRCIFIYTLHSVALASHTATGIAQVVWHASPIRTGFQQRCCGRETKLIILNKLHIKQILTYDRTQLKSISNQCVFSWDWVEERTSEAVSYTNTHGQSSTHRQDE